MKRILILCLLVLLFVPASAQTLLLFGGRNHDVFLGEFNTSNYSTNSIWNEFGPYGNSYGSTSIWNSFGDYGSAYSATSPFNAYATTPPVVVDENGGFYGYFTVDRYKAQRAEFQLALIVYEYHEEIAENVSKWYGRIFEQ